MKVADLQRQAALRQIQFDKTRPVQGPAENAGNVPGKAGVPFADILKETLHQNNALKFSAHAVKRIEERNLQITPEEINRIDQGMQRLNEKGSKNSLILVDDTAYVVSINNKTVVTAVPNAQLEQQVFTNIDSVAIV